MLTILRGQPWELIGGRFRRQSGVLSLFYASEWNVEPLYSTHTDTEESLLSLKQGCSVQGLVKSPGSQTSRIFTNSKNAVRELLKFRQTSCPLFKTLGFNC